MGAVEISGIGGLSAFPRLIFTIIAFALPRATLSSWLLIVSISPSSPLLTKKKTTSCFDNDEMSPSLTSPELIDDPSGKTLLSLG